MSFTAYLKDSADVILACEKMEKTLVLAAAQIAEVLFQNKPLLVCGNGGSAADAQHITGELVGRFKRERRGLKAICLTSNSAILTAWSNDYSYDTVFSRQVEAYGEAGGVLLGLSTSGNSPNVVAAFEQARLSGMRTIAMTGQTGGKLAALADVLIAAPSTSTPLIQQAHLCCYHFLCDAIEATLVDWDKSISAPPAVSL